MASISLGLAALIGGGLGAAGSIASSVIGSDAAQTASQQQSTADQAGIAEQQREFDIQQGNSQPFIQAGQSSIAQIMKSLQDGTFGQSQPAPQFTGGTFKAPTLAEVQQTPGYQFTQNQGDQGILAGAAAAGGNINGGTFKSLDQYNTNLANTTYGDRFNQALQTYNAGITGYQAQLAGYGANLAGQNQSFNQLLAPAQIGSGAAASANATGAQTSNSIAQLMASLGQSQASGTVGSANAITGGINTATSGISNYALLQALTSKQSALSSGGGGGLTAAQISAGLGGG